MAKRLLDLSSSSFDSALPLASSRGLFAVRGKQGLQISSCLSHTSRTQQLVTHAQCTSALARAASNRKGRTGIQRLRAALAALISLWVTVRAHFEFLARSIVALIASRISNNLDSRSMTTDITHQDNIIFSLHICINLSASSSPCA